VAAATTGDAAPPDPAADGAPGPSGGPGTSGRPGTSGGGAPEEDEAVAAVAMSAVLQRVDYPLYVVTASDGHGTSGCLAGFVTQCSILPARMLVCVSKENHTAGVASRSDALGVHLLGEDQLPLAAVFGELTGDRTDKFAGVAWHPGSTGAPLLAECAAWFEGSVRGRVDLGDHVGYVLDPVAGGGGGHRGQLTYGRARHLHPGHPPGEG
jgi:flavin reductase (DIM6/NTAB) family NADH-FMN oxidoreductase RutF